MIEDTRLYNQAMKTKRIEALRRCINDEAYMYAAVQRLAFVLSKELLDINASKMRRIKDAASEMRRQENNEQLRKGRK